MSINTAPIPDAPTPWHTGPMLAFDTESTGTNARTDRIVSATLALVNAGPVQIHTWLVNPGIPIPAEATDVHGISTQRVQEEGREPSAVLAEMLDQLRCAWEANWPTVIYNAPYDLTLLDHELLRHGLPSLTASGGPGLIIDPFVLDRALDPTRNGRRTLSAVAAHYGVVLGEAHDATEDALAAARIAWRLAQSRPALAHSPLSQLQTLQAGWYAEHAEKLEDWLRFRRDDPELIIPREWPYALASG